jgi:hypothetical protein
MSSPALALAASVALLPLLPPVPLLALVPLDPLLDPPPPPPHPASANSNEESNNEWNFICEAQSENTGPATSLHRVRRRELNIGFVVRQAMPRLGLARSLPADIGGPKHVCRTMGASYVAGAAWGLTMDVAASDSRDASGPAGCVR